MVSTDNSSDSTTRRRVLQGLGAASISSIAGCGGNGGGDNGGGGNGGGGNGGGGNGGGSGDLGERVPTTTFQYWTGLGVYTADQENMVPTIRNNWEELGLDIEVDGLTYPSMISWMSDDQRQAPLNFFGHGPTPSRLDPNEMLARFGIHRAGGNGIDNPANYPNCDFTDLFFEQASAPDLETRQEQVQEALKTRSNDYWCIATCARPVHGAYNADKVNAQGIGNFGLNVYNQIFNVKSRLKTGDTMRVSLLGGTLATKNYYTMPGTTSLAMWQHLVNSCLLEYNEDLELVNALAESVETQNEGKEVVVKLRDGTFHNGDPITAEDVKFTFEFIRGNPGAFPKATSPNYNSIEVEDEKTVRFKGEKPFPPLITRAMPFWGILHKESWVASGAPDDPGNAYPEEIIGSGPYQVTNFQAESLVALEPHEGHALRGVKEGWDPEKKIIGQVFDEEESAYQAFQQKNIDVMGSIAVGTLDRAEQLDFAEGNSTATFLNYPIYPQHPMAPTKFEEFRLAVGRAINRKKLNAVAFGGRTSPDTYAEVLAETHPFRNNEGLGRYTDDPTGDIEGARQALADAGWGWDNNDRLHYPSDADMEPLWAKGERPQPDDFPCMEERNGEITYVKPNGQPYGSN